MAWIISWLGIGFLLYGELNWYEVKQFGKKGKVSRVIWLISNICCLQKNSDIVIFKDKLRTIQWAFEDEILNIEWFLLHVQLWL